MMNLPKNELEKLNLIGELKGQIIDIFEDFLESKNITIDNPEKNEDENLDIESAAIIFGSDYDAIGDKLEDLFANWDIFKNEVAIDTPAGKLIAYVRSTPDNPNAGVMFKPKDLDCEADLFYAETKRGELLKETSEEKDDEQTIFMYTYADIYTEDYTNKNKISRDDVVNAFADAFADIDSDE